MRKVCEYCGQWPPPWGKAEVEARWRDAEGVLSEDTYWVCCDCASAGVPGGPGYEPVEALMRLWCQPDKPHPS